jgi:hypothetical protein
MDTKTAPDTTIMTVPQSEAAKIVAALHEQNQLKTKKS